MAVQIVTDSGADIPAGLVKSLGIEIVPLNVTFGSESYQDGLEISGDEFYHRLLTGDVHPTTSQPSVGSFIETYQAIHKTSKEILSIHVSSKLSGTVNSATQAASEENLGSSIEIIDSWQASIGLGFSVIAAAKAAQEGASLEKAAKEARSVLSRTHVYILFDTLKYLERGGRIGKASALLGSIMRIKPILTLSEGEIGTALKVRTYSKGIESLKQIVSGLGKLDAAAILHTTTEDKAKNLADELDNPFKKGAKPLTLRLSPAIGVHGGPGVLGIVCVTSE